MLRLSTAIPSPRLTAIWGDKWEAIFPPLRTTAPLIDLCLARLESLRQQISGVSLDNEAVNLMEYERAYDAISKMVGVLTNLTLDVINLLPPQDA